MDKEKRQKYMQEYLAKYHQSHHDTKLTFTNKEYEIIQKIAKKQGIRIATFIRYATMEQAKHLYLFPKDIEDDIKIAVRNMRGIGNNINQIARYSNEQGYTSPDSMEVVYNFLKDMENEVKSIKQIITRKIKRY
ncbi:MAG: MobC family plasmid mobilization relaxosome protein [Desulfarculales bacterium]|jgi:hypothetical protein|nr:MobC family plasmid mobilization relaxosome protein [Desulfarculales bacterium]